MATKTDIIKNAFDQLYADLGDDLKTFLASSSIIRTGKAWRSSGLTSGIGCKWVCADASHLFLLEVSNSELGIIAKTPKISERFYRDKYVSSGNPGVSFLLNKEWGVDLKFNKAACDLINAVAGSIGKAPYISSTDESEMMKPKRGTKTTSSVPSPAVSVASGPDNTLTEVANKCKELLAANHNIILSGAPGTGKTYMAKQIALAITGSENRIEFVQFHPSYDYTDFVEGLRPTPPSGSTIGFERKDGIFKEFCEKALKDSGSASISSAVTASSPSSVTTAYKSLAAAIKSGTVSSLPLKSKGVSMDASVSVDNIILSTKGGGKSYPVSLDKISKLSEKFPDKASLDGMKNIDKEIRSVLGGCHSSSIWAVLHEIYDRMEQHKYVFIIDEINRGEMSKVFGELFFSIDPGYRGAEGKVRTQYANMVSAPNAFDKVLGVTDPKDCGHFFVPENVYIIGTMNDIDRSVDTMDFAMRRRFLIKEIKAEDTQNEMLTDENVKAKMNALNDIIGDTSDKRNLKARLGSAYALGASYFMKYEKYSGTDKEKFRSLWDNHLEGILREYLRGTADPDSDLRELKKAYDPDQSIFNRES